MFGLVYVGLEPTPQTKQRSFKTQRSCGHGAQQCLLPHIFVPVRLAVAEVFGIFVGVAEVVVDQDGGLARQFEAFAALVTGDEVVEARHI